MTLTETVSKAKEIGFDAIEFTNMPGKNYSEQVEYAKLLRKEADGLHMTINAYTINANLYYDNEEESKKEIERLKGQVDIAEILGASVMRHDVCGKLGKRGNSRSFGLMLPTIAKNTRAVAEYAEKIGIKTCTENHGMIAQDSYRVEQLFNAVAHDNYGLLVDFGNFLCVDEDPVTAVSRVAPYAVHCHIKDMLVLREPGSPSFATRGGAYLRGVALGEGVVPLERCLRIMKKADYDGYVSLEYEGSEDCVEGIVKGCKKIRELLSRIEG